jgi:hypothetical protein
LLAGLAFRRFCGWRIAHESVLMRRRPEARHFTEFHRRFRQVFLPIAQGLAEFHRRGIVLGDLSPNNILVSGDRSRIRFIDFEAACQTGVDIPISLGTTGYVAPRQGDRRDARNAADDLYALAAMMLCFVFPANLFFALEAGRMEDMVRALFADARLPPRITEAVVAGLSPDPALRPGAAQMAYALQAFDLDPPAHPPAPRTEPESPVDLARVDAMIDGISAFMAAHADPSREDRLFPCDSRAFEANTLCLGHGACGSLFGLSLAGVAPTAAARDWLQHHPIENDRFAPGLLTGQAGIAWVLCEWQETQAAGALLMQARGHRLFERTPSLFAGMAGWAMCALRLFLQTQDQRWRDAAIGVVDDILARAQLDDEGRLHWPASDGKVALGLGYGAAGIALVLLYAGLVTDQERYIAAGLRALRHELSHAQAASDGSGALAWSYTTADSRILLPYLMHGSAGIGAVMLRYRHLAHIDEFDAALEGIYVDTDCRYAVGFGRLMGLAGIAGFRLDALHYTGQQRHRAAVARLVRTIDMFRVDCEQGLAYRAPRWTAYPATTGTAPRASWRCWRACGAGRRTS